MKTTRVSDMTRKTKFNSGDRVVSKIQSFMPGAVGIISPKSFEDGRNPDVNGYLVDFTFISSDGYVLMFEDEIEPSQS